MALYTFSGYRLDTHSLTLTRRGAPIPLRPKTAAVLAVLVESRTDIVGKRRLAERVWRTPHVSDHSLFQAISELRRALAPLACIKTHPNLGYQWVAPTRRAPAAPRLAAAAALAMTVAGLGAVVGLAPGPGHANAYPALPPAMQALAQGLESLAADEPAQAQAFFELALRENPSFDEARLLLSEALLAQGDVDAARSNTRALVDSALPADPYVTVAAMALLSRADERAGQRPSALRWALEAAGRARDRGFVCVAADIEGRIVEMMSPVTETAADRSRVDALLSPAAARPRAIADVVPAYCEQMRPTTPVPEARAPASTPSAGGSRVACGVRKHASISNA